MKKFLPAIFAAVLMAMTGHAHADAPKTAIFAGGCFWCMESDFDDKKGVLKVTSGYTGGTTVNPTYEEVSSGATGHLESVEVTYDPAVVSYAGLLTIYWQNVDPFDAEGQFCDKGTQYHAAIFYGNDDEKALAEESLKKVEQKFGKPVEALLKPASIFYPAEEYHQGYHKKNAFSYGMYRRGCGRDARTKELWGDKQ
ncbi:MAG: peptide-methionine (S)-S-oxide reductase MsrA [Micavibrio sp.]|nr:peptide-methionine (S)-S-oxide reductase MsrA [Micavibrio sp.]